METAVVIVGKVKCMIERAFVSRASSELEKKQVVKKTDAVVVLDGGDVS